MAESILWKSMPEEICDDCCQKGCTVLYYGPLAPYELRMHLCPDCFSSRADWFTKFNTPMLKTYDFLAGHTVLAQANLKPDQMALVSRIVHVMRTTFMGEAKDWQIFWNHGLIIAIKLDPKTHIRMDLNFRTGAALGRLIVEDEFTHSKNPQEAIPREALNLSDWNEIIGWLGWVKITWDRELKTWASNRYKLITDLEFQGGVLPRTTWVEIREDHQCFRIADAESKSWVWDPEVVQTLLDERYAVPEGVDEGEVDWNTWLQNVDEIGL